MPAKKKKPAKSKLKRGRPSLYLPEYAEQARKLCLLGLTNDELAEFFGVNVDTIHEWKKRHQDFSDAICAGKLKADADVAAKLHERAMGAEWVEDQAFKIKTVEYAGNGRKISEREEIQVVPVRRAAPPDTPALSLWLRNRQPAKWRDKPEPADDDNKAQPEPVTLKEVDGRKPGAEPQ
ncbi:hypothetical protein [Hymenobacter fodinae]|uniref:Terminase n=1 Tax=Hymenobacter fodinae TaxID=2510796 RepID=A0A4Z0P1L8_9BACT|nr:hypothetical protein [Hymenobacter fodinae]TGE04640.1 hypothetical protein EU556_20865 [Hymenobacter fodinae]